MCLVLFAWRVHPDYPLVLAANRDEFRARPTAPLHFWDEVPHLLAGRDLRDGGTWLGVTRAGRWAALTNFREPPAPLDGAPSRGTLVARYLRGDTPPDRFLEEVAAEGERFQGFNLLAGDTRSAWWLSNRAPGRGPLPVEPGIHGLSNHLLDTPWPKVGRGRRELARLLERDPDPDPLLRLLLDRTLASDLELPSTGVGAERERALSAIFIAGPEYGTRSSTALLLGPRHALVVERTFAPESPGWTERREALTLSPA